MIAKIPTAVKSENSFRVMSGMRATGKAHIGHYFGSLQTWLHLQTSYDCYFGVMDWHGMTTAYKSSEQVPAWIRDLYIEFLAWGIDPQKSTLFVQSAIPEHLELFMIFANLTPMGWLERVPTWKDAEDEAKQSDTHNLGRFSYPVLQAADVAIYLGEKIPVGQDQVAHLELTREIIRRFNHLYKGKLPEPTPLLTKTPLVPGLDGRKMSKSYQNGVDLTEDSKSLSKKVKAMPTDSKRVHRQDIGNPEDCNVMTYHQLFSSAKDCDWAKQGCLSAGIGCGDCKARLLENMESLMSGPREKKNNFLTDSTLIKSIDEIIFESNKKARKEAQKNLMQIKDWMKLK